jgi:hypothetical protein
VTFTKFDPRLWNLARARNPAIFAEIERLCLELHMLLGLKTTVERRIESIRASASFCRLQEAVKQLPTEVRPQIRNAWQAAVWSHLVIARLARRAL